MAGTSAHAPVACMPGDNFNACTIAAGTTVMGNVAGLGNGSTVTNNGTVRELS